MIMSYSLFMHSILCVFCDHFQHDLGKFRIKLSIHSIFDLALHVILRDDVTITSVAGHCVVSVRHCYAKSLRIPNGGNAAYYSPRIIPGINS